MSNTSYANPNPLGNLKNYLLKKLDLLVGPGEEGPSPERRLLDSISGEAFLEKFASSFEEHEYHSPETGRWSVNPVRHVRSLFEDSEVGNLVEHLAEDRGGPFLHLRKLPNAVMDLRVGTLGSGGEFEENEDATNMNNLLWGLERMLDFYMSANRLQEISNKK